MLFGEYEFDPAARELRKRGVRLHVQEQPLAVLAALLERPGEIVLRDELIARLWPHGTHVDFDRGLNAAVTRLRQALSDSAETPRYIETVARRGYRFVAPVKASADAAPPESELPRRAPDRKSVWTGLGTAAAILVMFVAWFLQDVRTGEPALPVPLTSYPGYESKATLSPDGSQAAFEWDEGTGGPHIFVKVVGAGDPVRLTGSSSVERNPAWSPDGRQIAFLRRSGSGLRTGVFVTPALGGVERKLAEFHTTPEVNFERLMRFAGTLAWTPDSASLLAAAAPNEGIGSGLLLISAATGETRWLLPPEGGPMTGLSHPAFSPDGRELVFLRKSSFQIGTLHTVRLTSDLRPSGEPRPVTTMGSVCGGVAWFPDGASLLFSAGYVTPMHLFRIGARGGPAERLLLAGSAATQPVLSPRGRLVYTRITDDRNIWRQTLPQRPGAPLPDPEKWIASTELDRNAQYSPDGSRIAFQSSRSGYMQIWTCSAEGRGCVQVSQGFSGMDVGTPRWSPDGKQIVFDSAEAGNFDVYLVNSGGGSAKRLTDHPGDDAIPSFSRDGRYIYFWSVRTGNDEIWRIPVTGGTAVQITRSGGVAASESPDGRWLFYTRHYSPRRPQLMSLWRMALDGSGEDRKILDDVYHRHWTVARDKLWYLAARASGTELRYRDLVTGSDALAGKVPAPEDIGLSVSPDGRHVLFTKNDNPGSDLMLIENFR